jgi:hypothetical protein
MTHRYRILCAFTVLGCTPGTSRLPAPSSAEHDGHAASALSAALADTVSATRVYLPSEVAMPATVVSETEGQQAVPRSIVGPCAASRARHVARRRAVTPNNALPPTGTQAHHGSRPSAVRSYGRHRAGGYVARS